VPGWVSQFPTGAKVHQDDPTTVLPHDVLRLDVAVDQPGAVYGAERAAHGDADDARFFRAHGAIAAKELVERPAADEFHPDADGPALLLCAIHSDDVGVSDTGEQSSFAQDLGYTSWLP
jgi:hypothetical protein